MNKGIYISINKNATEKIVNKEKNHEFRNYIPKKKFNLMYVYVTAPVSKLMYIIELNQIIRFPDKIQYFGDGNDIFNLGDKSKFAYEIKKVIKLESPVPLKELKEIYEFIPPQSYAYTDRYLKLTEYINKQQKQLLWENSNAVQIEHK